MPKINKII